MRYESPEKNKQYRKLSLEIARRIAEKAKARGIRLTPLAVMAKVSQGNLSRMAKDGSCCLQLLALYRLADVLKTPIRTLLPAGARA